MFWIGIIGGLALFVMILGSNVVIRKSVNQEQTIYSELDEVYDQFDRKNLMEEEEEDQDEPLNLEIPNQS